MPVVRIGADPELFVWRNGHAISAHVFVAGTKFAPMKTKHGSIQNDGMALEVNVRPAKTKEQFKKNVAGVLHDLHLFVRSQDKSSVLRPTPSVTFRPGYIRWVPPEAKALGCTPDFDAYSMTMNERPNENSNMRTGAGHVHISWTTNAEVMSVEHMQRCGRLARLLDYYLGLPSLKWDEDNTRRTMYGNAGCFRPKSYGIEYRTLSNAWLKNETLVGVVFDQAMKAVKDFKKNRNPFEEYDKACYAREVINSGKYYWMKDLPKLWEKVAHPDLLRM